MPRGVVRTDLNTSGTSYRNGTPITLPKTFGNPVDLTTKNFGNVVDWTPSADHFGNPLTLPHEFGNTITDDTPDAIELIAHTAATNNGSFAGSQTTSPVDTTGANMIVVSTCANTPVVTDSYNNVWVNMSLDFFDPVQVFYCFSAVVGPDHTFTVTANSGGGNDCSLAVAAFSNLSLSDPRQLPIPAGVQVNSPTLTLQVGGVVPRQYDLVVAGLKTLVATAPISIDESFVIPDQSGIGSISGAALAYRIETSPTPSASQPTWTVTANNGFIAAQAGVFSHE